MLNSFKDSVFVLITISVVLYLTNFVGNIPRLAIWTATSLLIIKRHGGIVFKQKSFVMLNAFFVIYVLYGLLGFGTLSSSNYKAPLFSFVSLYTIFLISYHIKTMNCIEIKTLLYIALTAMALSVSIASFVATINPMAIRTCFGDMDTAELADASFYRSLGLMSYPQAHSLCVLCVALCVIFCYANNMFLKIFSFVLMLTTIKLQFDMTITTALLLSLICCTYVFLIRFAKGKIMFSLVLLIITAIVFLQSGMVDYLLSYAESENKEISMKLNDLFGSVESGTGQGQMEYRNYLYLTSFKTFLSNPILGLGRDNGSRIFIGEHSFLLDYLAYFGLFACLYFGAWWKHYKINIINNLTLYKREALCCTIPVIGLVFMKAPSVCAELPFALLVFILIVFMYIEYASSGSYDK